MSFRIESQAEPLPGYRLLSRLGGGGYGDVWKCEAPGGVYKAIKFVFGNLESVNAIGDEDETGRAEQELRSLDRIKRIRHPFILALDRYEIINGQLMIVSELADCSLHDRARECAANGLPGIPRDELLSFMLETAEALDYMTEKHDLLHLDVKPQNLFLLCNHIKVGDFGLVKDIEGHLANVTGGFTTIYAAPESFEGYVSRFSDQYSLAIVYQELLTGIRPYAGNNTKQLMLQHIQGKPNLDPLPEHERHVIARALSKTPTDRWPNCMAMVKALQNAHRVVAVKDQPTDTDLQQSNATIPAVPISSKNVNESMTYPVLDVDGTFTDRSQDTPKADPELVRSGVHRTLRTQKPKSASTNHHQAIQAKVDSQHGVLRPTLIIGLGQFGRATLNRIRTELISQIGVAEFPLLRTWAIDTDNTPPSSKLDKSKGSEDLLITGLSRPARYIRSRDSLPPVEDWLDSNILYRMPRTLQTNGIRAFGRLAFIEHYSAFTTRLERELQELLKPRTILEACKKTNCTLRNSQPLVYLVTHLGGGTGSGMFLDCAYVIRQVMQKMNIPEPDVNGLFFIPDARAMESPDLAEANALAALHELYHFQQTESPFKALYLSKMEPLTDTAPPFSQCLFFETPQLVSGKDRKTDPARPVIIQAANCLTKLCLSSVGRVVESHHQAQPEQTRYQALGLRTVVSPKKPLLKAAVKLVFNQVLDYWLRPITSKQHAYLLQSISDFFVKIDCHSEGLMNFFENSLASALESSPDDFIQTLIQPFKKPIRDYLPTAVEVQAALEKIMETLGNVKGDDSISMSMLNPVSLWSRALRNAGELKLNSVKKRLRYSLFQLFDRPGLRISAAEVAHRDMVMTLEKWIAHHGEQAKTAQRAFAVAVSVLREDALEYDRLRNVAKFRWPKMPTPGERLLTAYRDRYQAMFHERLAHFYEVVRNMCVDLLPELQQCRTRIMELRYDENSLKKNTKLTESSEHDAKTLFTPAGFTSIMEAARQISNDVTADDLEKLDVTLAERLAVSFPKLVEVCQASGAALHPLRDLIQSELISFLEQRTSMDNAVTLLLNKDQELGQELEKIYLEAAPPIVLDTPTNAHESVVVFIPDSPEGKILEHKIHHYLPDLQVLASPMAAEVVLFRAVHGFELNELAVFNEAGQHAYQTAQQIEHFTPHSRQDITEWFSPLLEEKPAPHSV